jgi:hypothetical protein
MFGSHSPSKGWEAGRALDTRYIYPSKKQAPSNYIEEPVFICYKKFLNFPKI